MGLIINGTEYNVRVSNLKRYAQIQDGGNARRTMTGKMERDPRGTLYSYSMDIDAAGTALAEYDALYELLSEPVDSYTITMPYGQTTKTFDAYITDVNDELAWQRFGRTKWSGLTVKFVAIDLLKVPE